MNLGLLSLPKRKWEDIILKDHAMNEWQWLAERQGGLETFGEEGEFK